MGSMRSKPATRKLTEGEQKVKGYHQCLEIVSTDVMKFNDKDVDGNIAVSGVYIPKTSYGDCLPLSSMTSIAKNRAWRDLQWDIQANTDPGGRMQYKLERMHTDQGSEHLGKA